MHAYLSTQEREMSYWILDNQILIKKSSILSSSYNWIRITLLAYQIRYPISGFLPYHSNRSTLQC